ncbi:MAG TPA: LysE family transporter [Beijerinckiaceae bacterium]|jgi:threonine/homoserine/homoserine lactone efflux protein
MSIAITALLTGIGVGLSVAVPVGPMSVLCMQRTLSAGLAAGLATGLGAATVHLAYGSAAALGPGAAAVGLFADAGKSLSLISALVLLWFAARLLRRDVAAPSTRVGQAGCLRAYGSAVLFGLSNPLTLLFFAAALPTLAGAATRGAEPLLAAGVFVGSVAWWTVLSVTLSVLKGGLSAGRLALANKASGLMLLTLAALTLADVFGLK